VALFQTVSWLFYTFEGRFFAFLVGWKKSYLGRGSRVIGTSSIDMGNRSCIGRYAWIEAVTKNNDHLFSPSIKIGNQFFASERLHISAINQIEIGDNCLFGSSVYICDHNHGAYKGNEQSHPAEPPINRKLVSYGPVIIGCNVWVGDNVTILGAIRIGNGVVVGANSVVTHDVPDNVIIGGVPAIILKKFNADSGIWEVCSHDFS